VEAIKMKSRARAFIVNKAVTGNNKFHVTIKGKTTSHETLRAAKAYANRKVRFADYHDAYENVRPISLSKSKTARKSRPKRSSGFGPFGFRF
jgi:hypothetical protein